MFFRKNKYITFLFTSIFLFFAIAGCANYHPPKPEDAPHILYIITSVDDAYRKTLSEAILEEGKEKSVYIDIVESHGDHAKELELVSTAKEKGYSAIILCLEDNSTALQMNQNSNDLPIIYINNQPPEEHLVANKYIFVGSNESQAGKFQAEYIISLLGTHAMNVAILEGVKGHSATTGRTAAIKDTLQNHGVNANYVYVDYANWSYEEAKEKFKKFIESGKTADVVFCNNDTMALGVIDAMKEMHIDYTSIPVTGVDATPEALKSVSQNEMAFTVRQDAQMQGQKAVEAAYNLAIGSDISEIDGSSINHKYIWVNFEPISKTNVSKYEN